ncbi:2Fe-2S iron-sulfur cluster-binding protein [Nocardia vinacea]|uniref:2Fe-2S iron-sulfur cluster-binding protein n=1 Tax=Nocardia vinacea TaxID=96468 RepID=UPI002E0E905D|nr:2Fe-2S iron-sulfur cluster-binding protein [Nocardia vinacea]
MPKIIFHHVGGETDIVETAAGVSVMHAAVRNSIAGVIGECGGQAMCATCHVLVRDPYLEGLPPIGEDEDEMLQCTASPRDDQRSRLGCQLTVGVDLEEVEVDVPESQI